MENKILKDIDLSSYNYCPIAYKNNYSYIKKLNLFEECIRKSILLAESTSLIKDSMVTLGKIIKAWDKIWWPIVVKYSINYKEAEKYSLSAIKKFSDYCKYDITDEEHPTILVDIPIEIEIDNRIIRTNIDLIKTNTKYKKKNLHIIDFTKKGLSQIEVASDPSILTASYLLFSHEKAIIKYTCIDLNEDNKKIHLSTATFRENDLLMAKKLIKHTLYGIKANIFIRKPWLCKECKKCPNL